MAAAAAFVVLPASAALASGPVSSQVSSATISLGPSGTVTDTVTVAGNATFGSPTGNVTFYVCQTGITQTLTNGPCSPLPANQFGSKLLTAGANNASTATTASFEPTAGGTWCFSAVYGGDSHYGTSNDNTDGTNLDPNECVLVTTDGSQSFSVISSVQVTLGAGDSVTDLVTVQGNSVGGAPTGSVNFYACQTGTSQVLSPSFCTPGITPEDTQTVSAGAGDTSSARSAAFTPTGGGTWCFSTVYGGDTNYVGSKDNTDGTNLDSNECVLVTTAPAPSSSHISSASINLGTGNTVFDTATVQGNGAGGSPTGNVKFYDCFVSSSPTISPGPCPESGNGDTEGLSSAAGDAATAQSATFTPTSPGTWCFSVAYQGDTNYGGSSDNTDGSNLDANECVLVAPAQSTVSTTSSGNITLSEGTATDSVKVAGNSVAGTPNGTVDFYVCQTGTSPTQNNSFCTPGATPQSSPGLTAGANFTATAQSAPFTPSSPGTWCFSAVYQGNTEYGQSSDNTDGTNLDGNECFFVSAIGPVVTTQPTSQTVALGANYSFTAAASGDPTPTVQWQSSTDGGHTFTDIGGANSTTYSVASTLANSGDFYRAVFTNFQGSATSNEAGGAVLGGTTPLSKSTFLIGNKVVKAGGAGWNVHSDATLSIAECATSVYSPYRCGTPVSATVLTGAVSAGHIMATPITILVGIIDSSGDVCGLAGSPTCYVVWTGNAGDSNFKALGFSVPLVTLGKSTLVVANYNDVVHAKHFPVGDSATAEECDSTANFLNLSTHCDSLTAVSGVASALGGVVAFTPTTYVTILEGASYSDPAGGTCLAGSTCHIEVVDNTDGGVITLVTPVGMHP